MEKEIRAMIIIEMLGRPKEHLVEMMNKSVEAIGNEEGVKILNKDTKDPKKVEQEGDKKAEEEQEVYSIFSEIEIEVEDINKLLRVLFTYMPSHIEILDPTEIPFKNYDMGTLFNEIGRRLHQYDALAKKMMYDNQILVNRLKPYLDKEKEDKEKSEKKED